MPTRKISELDGGPPAARICRHPEHNPPTHMYYENGIWEHTCPSCGAKTVFEVCKPTLSAKMEPAPELLGISATSATDLAASLLRQIAQLRNVPVPVLVQATVVATLTADGLEAEVLRQQRADLSRQIHAVLSSFHASASELRQKKPT